MIFVCSPGLAVVATAGSASFKRASTLWFWSGNCRSHVDTSNGEKRRLKHDSRNRRRFAGQGRLARGPKAFVGSSEPMARTSFFA